MGIVQKYENILEKSKYQALLPHMPTNHCISYVMILLPIHAGIKFNNLLPNFEKDNIILGIDPDTRKHKGQSADCPTYNSCEIIIYVVPIPYNMIRYWWYQTIM